MAINSCGMQVSEAHLKYMAEQKEYIDSVVNLLDRRDVIGPWTPALLNEYRALLLQHNMLRTDDRAKKRVLELLVTPG